MFFARAATFAARKAFPDMLGGLYSVEELAPDSYTVEDMEEVEAMVLDAGEQKPVKAATKRKPIGTVPPKKAKPVNKIAPNKGGK